MQTIVEKASQFSKTDPERVSILNKHEPRKDAEYVLWWATACPRTAWNDTFELAKAVANAAQLPLICLFSIDLEFYALGSMRHINFFLEGLDELSKNLLKKGFKLFVRFDPKGAPTALSIVGDDSTKLKGFGALAYAIITDKVHLKRSNFVLKTVAAKVDCPVVAVESSLTIPISIMAPKGEILPRAAWVKKWNSMYQDYIAKRPDIKPLVKVDPDLDLSRFGFPWQFVDREWTAADWLRDHSSLCQVLAASGVDPDIPVVSTAFRGGENSAKKLVAIFLSRKIDSYGYAVNHFGETKRGEYGSLLSPYLNFGYVSASDICSRAHAARLSNTKEANLAAFTEKLALRERAYARTVLVPDYDDYETISEGARQFVQRSIKMRRKRWYYSDEMWERALTHDPVWNGIQRELLFRGRNILNDRNTWCHKIIEYEEDPRNAFRLARKLNDKYMLDALGPIGYDAVVNCFENHEHYLDEQSRLRQEGPRRRTPSAWKSDAQALTLSQVFSETAIAVFQSAFF